MSSIPHSDPHVKPCTKCGEIKPITEYYVKVPATGRLFSWCKACHKVLTSPEVRVQNKLNAKPHSRDLTEKRCNTCGEIKPRGQFSPRSDTVGGLQATCKSCRAAKWTASNKANPEKVKLVQQKYNTESRDKRQASFSKYRETHREQLNEAARQSRLNNPEKSRAIVKRYKLRNPHLNRINVQRRRALRISNGGVFNLENWEEMKRFYDYTCLCCGLKEPEISLTIDHVVPLSRGGSHSKENIQPLCWDCNHKKYTKTLDFRNC